MYRFDVVDPIQTDPVMQQMLAEMTLHRSLLQAADPRLPLHAWRVGHIARQLAEAMGLSRRQVADAGIGGLLHDVGKLAVDGDLLGAPRTLADDDRLALRVHADASADWLEDHRYSASVVAIGRHHHERWDGAGYPVGLSGEQIPLLARIVAVADVWDALTRRQAWKSALPTPTALRILHDVGGTQLDPDVVSWLGDLVASGHLHEVAMPAAVPLSMPWGAGVGQGAWLA